MEVLPVAYSDKDEAAYMVRRLNEAFHFGAQDLKLSPEMREFNKAKARMKLKERGITPLAPLLRANSFADTGKHKQDPATRRENIIKRLLNEEVVGSSLIPGMKPEKVVPVPHPRHKKTGVL